MRVAVIGGTGLVGGHATKALRYAGHDAVIVRATLFHEFAAMVVGWTRQGP